MKTDRKTPDLQQEEMRRNPFQVPDGYFESFAERLQQRMKEDEASRVPVRRIGISTPWMAMAATLLAAALITTLVVRFASTGADQRIYPDIAILEQMHVLDDDRFLYEFYQEENVEMDENEAFASQAIEYLAINDVEMDLIFE